MSEDEDLDEEVAEFLRQQDVSERGLEPREAPTQVLGADEVDDEKAKALCRDVTRIIRLLGEKRDMDLRECKLVLQIDDPRNEEARKLGMEDSRGVSRDEMAVALEEVAAGQIPKDRIALRVLHGEMVNWPFLESDAAETPESVEVKAPTPGMHLQTVHVTPSASNRTLASALQQALHPTCYRAHCWPFCVAPAAQYPGMRACATAICASCAA